MTPFKRVFDIAIFALLLFLGACSNSDQYLFDSHNAQEINVEAFITNSFDLDAITRKSDTIQPGDSLVFITNIYPSKSVRSTEYYWTIDGEFFSNEFSFKKEIENPGVHQIAFVFVDLFGDTLSDTLSVTVASSPELDIANFIPANKTQNINPDDILYFAWNVNDPDSMWNLSYRFALKDSSGKSIVDTVLDQAYFAYYKGLKPLQKYTWTVSAFNEMSLESESNLVAHFFTNGKNNENGILGSIRTNSEENFYGYKITLLDSAWNLVQERNLSQSEKPTFNMAPLAQGAYNLIVSVEGRNEFIPDTISLRLAGGQIFDLDTILMQDFTPPTITSQFYLDTLYIAETLKFIIRDLGSGVSTTKTSAIFDNETISDAFMKGDTLFVPFAEKAKIKTWTYKLITIVATDYSNNKAKKNFYLRPNSTLVEVFSD